MKINFNKEVKNLKRNVKNLEKPPWHYNKKEMMMALSGSLIILGIIPKILNIQTWLDNDFNMSSYNPYSLLCYLPYSLIFLYIAYEKRMISFLILGIIGLLYTLLLVYGIIKTYLPLDPII